MLIGKNSDQVIDNPIFVDKLKVEYLKVNQKGDKIVETFNGEVEMEKADKQKYKGFIISIRNAEWKIIQTRL